MSVQTIERINEKIRHRDVRVCTEAELIREMAGASVVGSPDVVVVTFTCSLRGISCMILVPVAERGVFTRAKSITLDGVPGFPGPAPNERLGVVDTQFFAENRATQSLPVSVSGADILLRVMDNRTIRARCQSIEGGVFERSFRLEELEFARLVAYDTGVPAVKFSGESLPALLRYVSVGAKIFVNGGMGTVIGCGMRHRPEAPSLSFSVDMFGMDPLYLNEAATSASATLTVGIPLPMSSDEILHGLRGYVKGLERSGYKHSNHEMRLGEQIKQSMLEGKLLLTNSQYPVFECPQSN